MYDMQMPTMYPVTPNKDVNVDTTTTTTTTTTSNSNGTTTTTNGNIHSQYKPHSIYDTKTMQMAPYPIYPYNMSVAIAAQAMQQLAMQQHQPQQFYSYDTVNTNTNTNININITKKLGCTDLSLSKPTKLTLEPVPGPKKKLKLKRRAKSEKKSWTSNEIVLLLQCAKLLLHCDLKTITKAIYACIDRPPGKCWGRGAEKKLKRLLSFKNWRTCDKVQMSKLINKRLKDYHAENLSKDSKVYRVCREIAMKPTTSPML